MTENYRFTVLSHNFSMSFVLNTLSIISRDLSQARQHTFHVRSNCLGNISCLQCLSHKYAHIC